jgi:diguanylate cyclase (GGDEF)-like protein/PAS domain S-box-containing protein
VADRILWLDEDSVTQELAEKYLKASYSLHFFSDLSDARDYLYLQDCPLVVCSSGIPCNGETSPVRRIAEASPESSILYLYTEAEENTVLDAVRDGADHVLVKPFTQDQLQFMIQILFESYHRNLKGRRDDLKFQEEAQKTSEELKRANKNLREIRTYLDNLLNSSMDSILTMNHDFYITYANKGTSLMMGYSADVLMGLPFGSFLQGGENESEQLRQQLETAPIQNYSTEMLHEDGHFIPVIISLSRVCKPSGEVVSILAIIKDITEQKELENALKEKSITDDLTGLFNQRYFYEQLLSEMERSKRQNHPLSLLLFDVDHFKQYNDTYGHLEGNAVLKSIGDMVRESTRSYVDIGCRYGGDEFTIILPETGMHHAFNIAERLRNSFATRKFDHCTLSIGLITYDSDFTAETFIRYADEMMYLAKRSGGNQICAFTEERKAEQQEG